MIGKASNEIYAQFFIRIYEEIPNCILAAFSKIKLFQAPNFKKFRCVFQAKLEKGFIVPSYTFDNVGGKFPIGFFVWDLEHKEIFTEFKSEVFDEKGYELPQKYILNYDSDLLINDWIKLFEIKSANENIGTLMFDSSDFQANDKIVLTNKEYLGHHHYPEIYAENTIPYFIFFSVRQCIDFYWLNDRDQFLYPNDGWQNDKEFQSDCLIYALFHGQNRITCEKGINHWIPFTEQQVGCKKAFKSNFMSKFLNGEVEVKKSDDMFSENESAKSEKVVLSEEAQNVYNAGLELWKYYHSQPKANPDASYYDIRKFFQGETKGRMNNGSNDEKYNELIGDLRNKMKLLAKKIEPKVYEYGFLK